MSFRSGDEFASIRGSRSTYERDDTSTWFTPMYFSRMRSKGSRFTLGVWGLRVCSLDVAFVVATVRNRPQPFA